MKISVWEPFREMDRFRARLDPARFWPSARALPEFVDSQLQWSPSADISETDAAGVRAESKDGVLTVHIPKRPVAKPAPLQIKVN